ncbi:recombinase family protein [Streptomyces lydicus]|uniref:recombinase family protein n=1 Tax=Streptomyces lydicus TaxID=47763 RepID=UPI0036E4A346
MAIRFLGARRLSRVKDNSTSFDRQAAAIEVTARAVGGEVIEWADDPDVSASKIGPFDRPGIGEWLKRPSEYDGIIWWRQDRAIRDMGDMFDLGRWAKANKKRLIFAEGPFGDRFELDFSSPMSELIVLLLAFAAQMEGTAIKERTLGTAEYLRSVGRWGGGRVPFGRVPVPHPIERDEKTGEPAGYWLARHEETAALIDEMVARALSPERRISSYHAIANWLNTAHPGMTPDNHRRKLKGTEEDPKLRWNPGMISALLRNPTLRGYKLLRGEIVRTDDGEPVMCGDPLIDDDVWYRLQKVMDSREQRPSENRSDVHPLLGVLFCASCQGRLYQGWLAPGPNRKVAKRQYRCAAKAHGRPCESPAYVMAEPVDKFVEERFLRMLGNFEVVEVVEFPGVDHTAEMADLEATIEDLSARIATLRGAAADALMGQLQGRSDRLERLQAEPVVPARVEHVSTGRSYREMWDATKDATERLDMLKAAGVRVEVGPTYRGCRDVAKRLTFTAAQFEDPRADILSAIEREEMA